MTRRERQDRYWMEMAAFETSGLYPGIRTDHIPPKVARRLDAAGYLTIFQPHNPGHSPRYVLTNAGRAHLAAMKKGNTQ